MPTRTKQAVKQATKETGDGAGAGLLTMEETIELLKTTRPTFYRWLRSGKLKGVKVGRQWRFIREDVDRFLNGQTPQIELTADIGPLIKQLESRLEKAGGKKSAQAADGKVDEAVKLMIKLSLATSASDIHIDPQEGGAKVRLRVDGALHEVATFDLRLVPAVAERIKSMGGMDVREKAMPQDGRILVDHEGDKADLRVCVAPSILGEAVTIRVLRAGHIMLDLDRLPYSPNVRERIERMIQLPSGMMVVTGPTGCGKTTTLYATLLRMTKVQRKVVSVEDPVEYMLPGVTQLRVNHANGMGFVPLMRTVYRMDPDVVMMGEVQNADALQLCFQAALTGHVMLTTLHAEDAAAGLRRMMDIGVEPFVVADGLKMIMSQRLVRKLCPKCSVAREPSAVLLSSAEKLARSGGAHWDGLPRNFRTAAGCPACGNLGYKGRTVIAEALEMTADVASALRRNAGLSELRRIAVASGMATMAADGISRAAAGEVSLEEVLAVASVD